MQLNDVEGACSRDAEQRVYKVREPLTNAMLEADKTTTFLMRDYVRGVRPETSDLVNSALMNLLLKRN